MLTDGRTDGQKIGRLYRTLLQAGAIKMILSRNVKGIFVASLYLDLEQLIGLFKMRLFTMIPFSPISFAFCTGENMKMTC